MKKTMRKLIPAVIMLLIAAMFVGTSTYAWFSMNKTVTVTGMKVTARVSDNILIAETNAEANYSGGIEQTRTALLAPTSTVDGTTYFFANSQTETLANGQAKDHAGNPNFTAYDESTGTALTDAAAGKEKYVAGFQAQAGVTGVIAVNNVAYGYIDYTFYLKATNAAATAQNLVMSRCNLLYNGAALGASDTAWRVAVFVADSAQATDTSGIGTKVTILAPTGAAYFNSTTAASATNARAAVTVGTAANIKSSIAAGTTVYEKVTVRLWLEGEDSNCKNETYVAMNGAWGLDLAFAFSDSNGVAAIGSTPITTSVDGAAGSITLTGGNLSNGETPATYAWKSAADNSAATGTNDAATYTATTTGSYYCLITTTDGNVYRTANLTLTVA